MDKIRREILEEREKEIDRRLEEEEKRLKKEGLIEKERNIRRVMDELYRSNYSADYPYSRQAERDEISKLSSYRPYYMLDYLYYVQGAPFGFEMEEEFINSLYKEVYQIRIKHRKLRRQEAERRLKPYPFPITIRSFHALKEFADGIAKKGDTGWVRFLGFFIDLMTKGKKFSGDNRGFSLEDDATVRASMTFEIDPETGETKVTKSHCSPTRHPKLGETVGTTRTKVEGSGVVYAATNPLFGFFTLIGATPDIDIRARFQITREKIMDEHYDILKVNGTVLGDDYPNTEVFIRDKSGNKIFLGTDVRIRGFDHIPEPIMGDVSTQIMSIDLEIKIDKNENFIAVKKDGEWVSVWNYNQVHLYKYPNRRR